MTLKQTRFYLVLFQLPQFCEQSSPLFIYSFSYLFSFHFHLSLTLTYRLTTPDHSQDFVMFFKVCSFLSANILIRSMRPQYVSSDIQVTFHLKVLFFLQLLFKITFRTQHSITKKRGILTLIQDIYSLTLPIASALLGLRWLLQFFREPQAWHSYLRSCSKVFEACQTVQ